MGNRFISRKQPAWHNIAKRIFSEDEVLCAGDAMREVAGDINIRSFPLSYSMDNVLGTTSIVDTGKKMLVRMPTADDPKPHELGIAEDSWVATSYTELAETLNDVTKTYKVETAGLLEDGGLAFLCFRGEDYAVKGDEMRSYFAANFSLTPGKGHKIFHSPVRVVCWNTNTMAEGQATINLSIPHSKDAKQRMTLAAKLVTQFHEMKDKAKDIFTAFADRPVTQQDVDTIIYAAFQLPALPAKLRLLKQTLSETESQAFKAGLTPDLLIDLSKEQEKYDAGIDKVNELRAAARESFESFNPPKLRGTLWAAYNAVTEVADWREGRNADEGALVGARAKEKGRAYEAAMLMLKA